MVGKKILRWAFFAALVFAIVAGWINRTAIYDWFRLRNYHPSSEVVSLANQTTMNASAKHLFYINHPTIENSTSFNNDCPNNGGEQTIVLGCYKSNETGIFLYAVKDPKLNGVEQVTAAHEMLHAAYDRLSVKDKNNVDILLLDYFEHSLKDKRLKDTIAAYKKTEPNDVVNEMHSIFGTEVDNLPKPLEDYYKRYFTNREKIVTYAQAYERTFSSRQAQAASLLEQIKVIESQLGALKSQIDTSENNLNSQYQILAAERHSSISPQAYNAQVDKYNAAVQAYKNLISNYNNLVAQHNQLAIKYQSIALETNRLFQELNSRAAAIPSR